MGSWGVGNPWSKVGGALKNAGSWYMNQGGWGSGSKSGGIGTPGMASAPVVIPQAPRAVHDPGHRADVQASIKKYGITPYVGYPKGTIPPYMMTAAQQAAAKKVAGAAGGSGGGGGGGGGGGLGGIASLSMKLATNPYDRALAEALADYNKGRGDTILGGKRQDADLAQLFSRLGNYTEQQRAGGNAGYANSGKAIGKNYDQLLSQITGSFKKGVGNTTSELARLGIQQVSPAAMAALGENASMLLNQGRIDKTNAGTNNTNQKNVFDSVMRELQASAGIEGTTQRGRAKQSTADALSALLANYSKSKTNLQGQKADAVLKARLQAAAAANAARQAALNRAARSSGGGGSSGGSPKTPRGLGGALSYLATVYGTDSPQFKDLQEAFQSGVNLQWDDKGHGDPRNAGKIIGYDANLDNLAKHWQNFTVPKHGWTQKQLNDLTTALAIYNGKG